MKYLGALATVDPQICLLTYAEIEIAGKNSSGHYKKKEIAHSYGPDSPRRDHAHSWQVRLVSVAPGK